MTRRQPISLAALRFALSEERRGAYQETGDPDDLHGVARYLWNAALASAMYPALHAVEVTFRNHIYATSCTIVDESALNFNDVPCWLDAEPSLLYVNEEQAVTEAKELLRKGGKRMTPGRLLSKLGFGFWCSLCRSPYEQGRKDGPGLWPGLITKGFPFLPRDQKSRPKILHRFDEIREIRNRVSHHEPIWDCNIVRIHDRVVSAIGWMNQGVADAVRNVAMVESISEEGLDPYRVLAERLVKP